MMLSDAQQQFMDWVENHIADALGYPVFSITGQVKPSHRTLADG